ncbi:hypothetical protein FRC12_002540 [Ceratobasidium sp. 428]|nr:hypothetical protein FRC12_002540 [Ceratobasidium sp. 428]
MPQSCRWAGGAPNCRNDGQCSTGEEELARDSHGDGAKVILFTGKEFAANVAVPSVFKVPRRSAVFLPSRKQTL